jgi:carbamoyl-phosphate synthase small subunit
MGNQVSGILPSRVPAVLALADGTFFLGYSVGYAGNHCVGEVVFNTAMTGYQEILTDPSYTKQIVTLTYPHIGNVGVNQQDAESAMAHASGLVIRELSPVTSNYRAEGGLQDFLQEQKIVAIAGVDTRALTRHLRNKGAMPGCICVNTTDPQLAIKQAKAAPSLVGANLANTVSVASSYEHTLGSWENESPSQDGPHVVVYDFGVKTQMLRLLADRGCRVTVVPADTVYADLSILEPDAVLLSNGPGDPAACHDIIAQVKQLIEGPWPIFGICLGCQLLALAMGAKTQKMPFGHHGANHPVWDVKQEQVAITSQNHGFVVAQADLPATLEVTHTSLFDESVQGFRHKEKPIFAIQGHPEACPGPDDWSGLFDQFVQSIPAATNN